MKTCHLILVALAFLWASAGGIDRGLARDSVLLAQTRADEERRREEQREERIKERREERRQEIERDQRERDRQWQEERERRQNRATEDLRRRREKEIFERFRRMEEGYPTSEERRRMPRDTRPEQAPPSGEAAALAKLFPKAWIPGILAGRVETGWDVGAVIVALGRPERITRTAPETEIWHYPATRVVVTRGIVTAVERPPRTKP